MIENSSIQNSKVGDKYIMDWQFELKLGHGSYSILSALAIPIDFERDNYLRTIFLLISSLWL
jgi:hypothetical protein